MLSALDMHILDEVAALELVKERRFNFILSICDDKHERRRLLTYFAAGHPDELLGLAFHDVAHPEFGHAPTSADMKEIIWFADKIRVRLENHDPVSLLIHCRAGMCRSPAAAQIILQRLGLSFAESQQEVKRLRPCAWPNRLMLALAAPLLETMSLIAMVPRSA
jgi:predicted protein tyrosine phosphatase